MKTTNSELEDPSAETTAIILAAGRGRRLGLGPKAFALLEGRSFLARGYELLSQGGVTNIIAVLPPGIPPGMTARLPNLRSVQNHDLDAGPIWSICLGLEMVKDTSLVMLHHVDHPVVRPATIRTLLVAARHAPYGVARVIPTFEGRRGHPIVIVSKGVEAIRTVTRPSETTLRDVLMSAGGVLEVPVEDPNILRNVNTQEELAKCT